ncbi:hypothetical protein PYCCODRAFT_1462132 [Trametes coccinea BRFM310]|uniref:Uncharacterized protein n=1 Tax=Trametes coccinea (strain BRFM310) TaxID=1353009 RepID=A0A1Y2IAU7_TRAC3|nr:hypothetical protein PYCCODRAFT_1462132 [Trametes coccinea BRFM310]
MASERLLPARGSMLSLALPVLARAASNAARSTAHQGGTPTDPFSPASSISTDPPKFSPCVNSTIDQTPPPTGRSHHERDAAHDLYQSSPRAEFDQDPASDLGAHITVCRLCAHASTFILPPAESIETTAETTSSPVSSTAPVSRTSAAVSAVSDSVLTVISDPVSFSSLGGTHRRGPSLSLPTVFGPTQVPGPLSRPISMSSARSNFPPTSLSNSYSSTTFGPGRQPTSSSAGQPATTTVVLTSPGSSIEEEAPPEEEGKEDGEEGCALHAPPLEAATASPGDAHPTPLPPHADPAPSEPSGIPPAALPAPPFQSPRQDAILSTHGIPEPLPTVTAAPPMLPGAERVEDEKGPPPSRLAAAADDQGDTGPEQHTESQGAPLSAVQGAFRAFEARARRGGLGLGSSLRSFDREFAEDEDPPPYEPRA